MLFIANSTILLTIKLERLFVRSSLERLIKEGLNRHDAIHAIASIICIDLFDMMKHGASFSQERYAERLEELTAKKWLQPDN